MVYIYFFLLSIMSCMQAKHKPIDVVYTWVNGSDPAWKQERAAYISSNVHIDAIKDKRFRDHNELKYSLRSIYMFAPFVNHIFIVTNGQRPKWLKPHPKITIIDHKDIFQNHAHLPTYAALAIESNLHRIPALSEHYVYFNDDFFLGSTITHKDLYTKKGKIRIFETNTKIPMHATLEHAHHVIMLPAIQTGNILRKAFGQDKRPRFLHHAPYVMKKTLVSKAEKKFPFAFSHASAQRFRVPNNYRILCCLIPYMGLYTNQAIPSFPKIEYVSIKSILHVDKPKLDSILDNRPMFFCIQDEAETVSQDAEAYIQSFFETYFPFPGPWEI